MKKVFSWANLSLWIIGLSLIMASCSKVEVSPYGSIYGRVTDSNGNAIASVNIAITPGGKTATTGTEGRFEFNQLEAKQYTISASKDGYISETKTVSVTAEQTTQVDIVMRSNIVSEGFDLSTTSLNFSTTVTSQSFDIVNNGNSGEIKWSIEDVPNWLTFSPTQGSTPAGKSTAVVVKADIAKQPTTTSAVVRVVCGSEAKSLTIYLTVEETNPLDLSVNAIDFGTTDTERQFVISNVSAAQIDWQASNSYSWLTLTPSSGSIPASSSTSVVATIDRSLITSSTSTNINIVSGKYSVSLTVKVSVESTPDDPNTPDDPDTPTENEFSMVKIQSNSDELQYEMVESHVTSTGYTEIVLNVKNIGSQTLSLDYRPKDSRSYAYDTDGNKYSLYSFGVGSATGYNYGELPAGVTSKLYIRIETKTVTEFSNITVWTYKPIAGAVLVLENVPVY